MPFLRVLVSLRHEGGLAIDHVSHGDVSGLKGSQEAAEGKRVHCLRAAVEPDDHGVEDRGHGAVELTLGTSSLGATPAPDLAAHFLYPDANVHDHGALR